LRLQKSVNQEYDLYTLLENSNVVENDIDWHEVHFYPTYFKIREKEIAPLKFFWSPS